MDALKNFANDHHETWCLYARSFPKSANADEQGNTLSGLHGRYVLVLADESGDIAPTFERRSEQALSNCTFGKIVQASKPMPRTNTTKAWRWGCSAW